MKQVYIVIAITLSFISTAHAESWGAVIPAVEKRAAFYLAEADRLGYANTSKSDVDYLDYYREDHECGILGRMLDLADVVADAERLDTPRIADDLSEIEVIQLFAAGRTLESWVMQAKHALSQTKEERVQHWNQSCADSERFEYAPSLLIADVPSFNAFAISNSKNSNLKTSAHSIAMPDFEGRDKSARMFRTRIRNGLAEGANFNGHYSFITFGCGTSCVMSYITDTRTGKVFQPPFGGESTPELAIEFKVDSNLIQVIHMGDTSEECQVRAWSFDGEGFKLEGEDGFAREGSCNYGQKLVSK
ncbi:hypothetical protein [Psychrobacter sp. DAB_AL62B]|uniref:hypothetical protein n=1 Tax=Psychrobacter sp. DAB_AL62B TaxID=1028420 RepID=UPI002380F286|nr:hypothetical protein [Psychrobacter sp. DAB_AL62B]MDE4456082.1 hypothetical protein [Psychrobacter sp. DAB_AL62B]